MLHSCDVTHSPLIGCIKEINNAILTPKTHKYFEIEHEVDKISDSDIMGSVLSRLLVISAIHPRCVLHQHLSMYGGLYSDESDWAVTPMILLKLKITNTHWRNEAGTN